MKVNAPTPDRGHVAFPHFQDKYKCCCHTVHVKQGVLIIGIFSAITAVIGMLANVFAKQESALTIVFETIYFGVEMLCIVLLFLAIRKNQKLFLIPFAFYQMLSVLFCLIVAGLGMWVLIQPDSSLGKYIRESLVSREELEIQMKHPEMQSMMILRMASAFLCTAFILATLVGLWWLHVIYKCYRYFADIDKHLEQFDPAVAYDVRGDVTAF